MPVNVLALTGFGILGFVEPALWLIGAGLETAYLFALASNARFQKLVEGEELLTERAAEATVELDEMALLVKLDARLAARVTGLAKAIDSIAELYRTQHGGDTLLEANLETLRQLADLHRQLSLAAARTAAAEQASDPVGIGRQIAMIEREIADPALPEAARESKRATLELQQRRLANSEQRRAQLVEISANLERIETQVNLALDDAASKGAPAAVNANLAAYDQIITSNQDLARTYQAQ